MPFILQPVNRKKWCLIGRPRKCWLYNVTDCWLAKSHSGTRQICHEVIYVLIRLMHFKGLYAAVYGGLIIINYNLTSKLERQGMEFKRVKNLSFSASCSLLSLQAQLFKITYIYLLSLSATLCILNRHPFREIGAASV